MNLNQLLADRSGHMIGTDGNVARPANEEEVLDPAQPIRRLAMVEPAQPMRRLTVVGIKESKVFNQLLLAFINQKIVIFSIWPPYLLNIGELIFIALFLALLKLMSQD